MKDFEKQYFRNAKHNLVMRRRTKIVLTALSLVVAVIVTWSLHLTGETTSTITYCGIEEHSHSEECVTKNLKCGTDESDSTDALLVFSRRLRDISCRGRQCGG